MIALMSEITDEISFGRQDHHLHLCPEIKQVWSSGLHKGTSRIQTTFCDYESDALATKLTWPNNMMCMTWHMWHVGPNVTYINGVTGHV